MADERKNYIPPIAQKPVILIAAQPLSVVQNMEMQVAMLSQSAMDFKWRYRDAFETDMIRNIAGKTGLYDIIEAWDTGFEGKLRKAIAEGRTFLEAGAVIFPQKNESGATLSVPTQRVTAASLLETIRHRGIPQETVDELMRDDRRERGVTEEMESAAVEAIASAGRRDGASVVTIDAAMPSTLELLPIADRLGDDLIIAVGKNGVTVFGRDAELIGERLRGGEKELAEAAGRSNLTALLVTPPEGVSARELGDVILNNLKPLTYRPDPVNINDVGKLSGAAYNLLGSASGPDRECILAATKLFDLDSLCLWPEVLCGDDGREAFVSTLAEDMHERWAKDLFDKGWAWGQEENTALKTHPMLLPYGHTTLEWHSRFEQTAQRLCDRIGAIRHDAIRITLAMPEVLEENNRHVADRKEQAARDFHPQPVGRTEDYPELVQPLARLRSGGDPTEGDLLDAAQDVRVVASAFDLRTRTDPRLPFTDRQREQMRDVLAREAHTDYVIEKQKAGWTYGNDPVRKEDPALIPYDLLSPDDKEMFGILADADNVIAAIDTLRRERLEKINEDLIKEEKLEAVIMPKDYSSVELSETGEALVTSYAIRLYNWEAGDDLRWEDASEETKAAYLEAAREDVLIIEDVYRPKEGDGYTNRPEGDTGVDLCVRVLKNELDGVQESPLKASDLVEPIETQRWLSHNMSVCLREGLDAVKSQHYDLAKGKIQDPLTTDWEEWMAVADEIGESHEAYLLYDALVGQAKAMIHGRAREEEEKAVEGIGEKSDWQLAGVKVGEAWGAEIKSGILGYYISSGNAQSPGYRSVVADDRKDCFRVTNPQGRTNLYRLGTGIVSKEWFDEIGRTDGDLAVVRRDGLYNHLDLRSGELISRSWCSKARDFSEGWAVIQAGPGDGEELAGKYNYVNEKGSLLSNEWFDSAKDFRNGRGIVTVGSETLKVDGKANFSTIVHGPGEVQQKEEGPRTRRPRIEGTDKAELLYELVFVTKQDGSSEQEDNQLSIHR